MHAKLHFYASQHENCGGSQPVPTGLISAHPRCLVPMRPGKFRERKKWHSKALKSQQSNLCVPMTKLLCVFTYVSVGSLKVIWLKNYVAQSNIMVFQKAFELLYLLSLKMILQNCHLKRWSYGVYNQKNREDINRNRLCNFSLFGYIYGIWHLLICHLTFILNFVFLFCILFLSLNINLFILIGD